MAKEPKPQKAGKDLGGKLRAPKLTPGQVQAVIVGEDYHVFPNTTTTVCCLRLVNGFAVIGQSATVSAENFDAEEGRRIAREDAQRRIWELEGYLLRESLSQAQG
jgi:hypothetical protein